MSRARVIYIWTHDSIALGEDGPTHQPVEQLASLRAMPNMIVVRPSDATMREFGFRPAHVVETAKAVLKQSSS